MHYAPVVFDLSEKSVCVAGSTGFLGSWIARELLSEGAVVRGVSLSGRDRDPFGIETVPVDLRDFEQASEVVHGHDALVIAAAVTSGAQVMAQNPLAHLLDNVLINGALIRAATLQGVKRVVFISSSTVYPVGDWAMSEDDFTGDYFASYEVVASMKRFAEETCRHIGLHSETEAIVVRPGNAYGPWDHFDSENSHVIPALVSRIARATSTLQVWGDGKDIKNFIYARDLARGIVQALQNGESGEIYNLGGPTEVSIRQIVDVLLDCAGKPDLHVEYDPSKPSMIPVRRINSTKAATDLGFVPTTSPEDGLRKTYEWYVKAKL